MKLLDVLLTFKPSLLSLGECNPGVTGMLMRAHVLAGFPCMALSVRGIVQGKVPLGILEFIHHLFLSG